MPIQTVNYSMIPAQGDPMLDAILPGLLAGMKAVNLPKQQQQQLQQTQLANALAQLQLQNAPDVMKAQLAHEQALTPYVNAETSHLNQATQLEPINSIISAMNSSRANSRFGNAYQLNKMLSAMSPAARASWIAQNQDAYTQAVNDIGNQISNPQNDNYSPMLQEAMKKVFGTLSPTQNKSNFNTPLTIDQQGINNLVNQGIAKPSFSNTPENTSQLQLAEQMAANQALTTPSSRRQAEASVNFDKFLADNQNDYAQAMKSISPYAGLIGKGKLSFDTLKSQNPQAYQDYQWFTNAFVPQIENQITQLEGSSVQKSKQAEIKNTFESAVKSLNTDPQSAINYMNRTISLLDQISKQRVNTAQPIFKDTFNKAYGFKGIPKPYINQSNVTQENLEFTARKHGMTIDQVKQKLGIQ